MLSSLRQSLRSLVRSPFHAVMAVLCLGTGMAATICAFSVMNGILRGDLPGISDRKSLSQMEMTIEAGTGGYRVRLITNSLRNFERLQAHGPAVASVAAEGEVKVSIRSGEDTISVVGAFVSGNYFATLGTQPVIGRLLGPQDDVVDGDAVMIGARLWRSQFNSARDVLGRVLRINGRQFRVVGVTPDRFTGLKLAQFGTEMNDRQIWLPMALARSWPSVDPETFVRLAVRHAPGVPREEAEREMNNLTGTLDPPVVAGQARVPRLALSEHGYGPRRVRLEEVLVVAAFFLPPFVVLAIACANVANLRLARATARVHELAVRLSLGASRGQVVRLLALESAALTAASTVVAWLMTRIVLTRFESFFPMSVTPDLSALAFVTAVAVGVLLVSGVAPAWRVAAALQASGLRQTAQSGGLAHSRLRNVLVAAQVALSIGLLTIGALALRTIAAADDRSAVTTDDLVIADLNLEQVGYDDAATVRFTNTLLARLQSDPRVRHAGMASARIFRMTEEFVSRPGQDESVRRVAHVAYVSPDWFAAIGVRTLAGRLLTDADQALPVAVINETAARALEPTGGVALGPLRIRGFPGPTGEPSRNVDAIGIVTDAISAPNAPRPQPAIYLPFGLQPTATPTLFVRTDDPAPLIADIRRTLTELEPKAPWANIETGASALARATTPIRYFGNAIGGLGLVALILATAGLYAVTLYATSLRTREIGIRVAIGAQQTDVVRLILRQALTVVGAGVVVGLVLVVPIAFAMRALFVGISPIDPLSLGPTVALLLAAGLAAAIVPALRASRIDPVRALRQD